MRTTIWLQEAGICRILNISRMTFKKILERNSFTVSNLTHNPTNPHYFYKCDEWVDIFEKNIVARKESYKEKIVKLKTA